MVKLAIAYQCVFLDRSVKNWDDAQFACQAFGWKLTEISSAAEQNQVQLFSEYIGLYGKLPKLQAAEVFNQ